MKHLMMTTALSILLATAATAQTEQETQEDDPSLVDQVTDNPSKVTEAAREATAAATDDLEDDDTVVEEVVGGDMGIDTERYNETTQAAFELDSLTVDDVIGAPVYDSSDNEIGEITSLIIDADGILIKAVIGMGGQSGMAYRQFALPIDVLDIEQSDDGYRIYVGMTSDELEVMPPYEG